MLFWGKAAKFRTPCGGVFNRFHVHNNGSMALRLYDGAASTAPLQNQIQMLSPQAAGLSNRKPASDWMEEHPLLEDLL